MLAEKLFLYLLRATGVFLLHISGMLESKNELEFYLPMFREALDYAGYLPHLYLFAMVSNFILNFELSIILIFQSLVLLAMPWRQFSVLFPKILSEAALCLAVFCLHCFVEDQVKTCSGTLLQLDEDFVRFTSIKRQVISSMS